ncbi:MAG: hypothetical protein ACI4OU_06440 [Candidatus Enterenecus sp.]
MKYVKRFWIPVVLLIAFIAAVIYTTRGSYPIAADGRMEWITAHQEKHLATLGAEEITGSYLADSLAIGDDLELQLWCFEAGGYAFDDIILWRQGSDGNYKMAYEYCIAQAAVEETFGGDCVEYSFQQGLYKYDGVIDGQLRIQEPTRSLSVVGPLLCAVLVVGYIVLTVVTLRYRRKEKEPEAQKG